MEPPECPVCLQPFSDHGALPRVLSCGHSTCEDCLSHLSSLPSPFPDSLRCPSCTQLVRLPRSLGPSSLPKNIDLLRLLPSSSNPPLYKPPKPFLLPTPHPLLPLWSPFILPPTPAPTSHRLHPLASSSSSDGEFRPIYLDRVARGLDRMGEVNRRALRSVLGFPRVLGLWMDEGEGVLYLVVRGVAVELRDIVETGGGGVVGLGMVGAEMCEAVARLHEEGVVCGCLGLECFGLDEWGHCVIDPGRVVSAGSRARRDMDGGLESRRSGQVFVSPEAVGLLGCEGKGSTDNDAGCEVGCSSDVWSLAGLLAMVVAGWFGCGCDDDEEGLVSPVDLGRVWMEKMVPALEGSPDLARFESLVRVVELCLSCHPERRPPVRELWRCMRDLVVNRQDDPLACVDLRMPASKKMSALLLCGLSSGLEFAGKASQVNEEDFLMVKCEDLGVDSAVSEQLERNGTNAQPVQKEQENGGLMNKKNGDLTNGIQVGGDADNILPAGVLKSATLLGHRDCITGLALQGDFLFSSSFDRTVHVWSLKDFSLLWTLKGHEHRITAILAVEAVREQVLCISADSGGFIFIWTIGFSTGQALLRQWREHNDWCYSGVHSLAALGSQYIYTGSGDKSIKAWSLQDYSHLCTMTGHTSRVSSLIVAQGILYSGSWDGTVRLWWLDDHSPLAVLGNDSPGLGFSVLSLASDGDLLVASYENGHMKVWRNDALVWSEQNHNGAIFAVQMKGKQFLSGGWDKVIKVQELLGNERKVDLRDVGNIPCNSVITCLLSGQEKLFVGLSNKEVKVYYYSLS